MRFFITTENTKIKLIMITFIIIEQYLDKDIVQQKTIWNIWNYVV